MTVEKDRNAWIYVFVLLLFLSFNSINKQSKYGSHPAWLISPLNVLFLI